MFQLPKKLIKPSFYVKNRSGNLANYQYFLPGTETVLCQSYAWSVVQIPVAKKDELAAVHSRLHC